MGHHSTHRSDVFSFAMTAVQLMTRAPPREENIVGQVDQAISECFSQQGIDTFAVDKIAEIVLRSASTVSDQRPTSGVVSQQLNEAMELLGGDVRDTSAHIEIVKLEIVAKQLAAERWNSRFKPDQGANTPPLAIHLTNDSTKRGTGSDATTVGSLSSSSLPSNAVSNAERDNAIAALSQWMLMACPDIGRSDNVHYCNLLYDHKTQTVDKAAKAVTNSKLPDWLHGDVGIPRVDAITLVEAFEAHLRDQSIDVIRQPAVNAHADTKPLTEEQCIQNISSEIVDDIVLSNGTQYSGSVKDVNGRTVADGEGIITYKDGTIYEGNITNNKRDGHGIFKWTNGDIYEGEWKNNKQEGHGIFKSSDGDVFVCEWTNDKKEGRGTQRYANGDVFNGEYKNDMKEGHGIMSYADGDVYEGDYKNNMKEGLGIFKYNNLTVYEGEFKHDKVEGHGIHKYADGRVYYEGKWKDNKPVKKSCMSRLFRK